MVTKGKKMTLTKGQAKPKPDTDNPDKNPLLHIENKRDFCIETSNLLETPDAMILREYEEFDLRLEGTNKLDTDRIREDTKIIVLLRYYEYLCTAEMSFNYIIPLLKSGLTAKDVFDMVKHCLKNKLLCNVPSFDTVFEPDIVYVGKVLY